MGERPMPAVKALIERDGKILALRTETSNSSYWVLPGGRIEYGEEPEEALERELQEEIKCDAEIGDTAGVYHFFIGPEEDGDQVVLTVFETDIGDQEVDIENNPADENIVEYRWIEPEELIQKTDNESLERLIREYSSDLPKLVRDRIPEIIRENGEEPVIERLEDSEVNSYVRDKVVEEAEEFRENADIGELADLLQVVERYLELENIDRDELEHLMEQKSIERGGFSENIILEDVEGPKE